MDIAYIASGRWLIKAAAEAYNRAREAGLPAGINSAGRTRAEQQALYNAWLKTGKKVPKTVAKPGTSNHESGLALDLPEPARSWMHANGAKFGFVQPAWAKKKATYEPWHFEFVGSTTSTIEGSVTVSNVTLPVIDLRNSRFTGEFAGMLQGLLLSHGFGPDGLVGADGRPDKDAGAKTKAALGAFQVATGTGSSDGSADYICGANTWAKLLRQ